MSKTTTVTTYGVEFGVEYTFYRGCRGAREHGSGVQLEPDEGPSVEIEAICLPGDVTEQDLSEVLQQKVIDSIEDLILEECLEPPDEG